MEVESSVGGTIVAIPDVLSRWRAVIRMTLLAHLHPLRAPPLTGEFGISTKTSVIFSWEQVVRREHMSFAPLEWGQCPRPVERISLAPAGFSTWKALTHALVFTLFHQWQKVILWSPFPLVFSISWFRSWAQVFYLLPLCPCAPTILT